VHEGDKALLMINELRNAFFTQQKLQRLIQHIANLDTTVIKAKTAQFQPTLKHKTVQFVTEVLNKDGPYPVGAPSELNVQKYDRAAAQTVSRRLPTAEAPGSIPGHIKWHS
jgi:hypothetical protein